MNKKHTKKIWELLRHLDSFCYICKKRIMLLCGQPEIKIGGCCVGYRFRGITWMTSRYAHFICYQKATSKNKTMETENKTIQMLKEIFQIKIKIEKNTLKNEPLCKGEWRKEIKRELVRYREFLEELMNPSKTQAKS